MTRYYYLFRYLLLGLIFVCSPLVIAAPDFEISELDTGKAIEQTVLTPYLADQNRADLLIISVSEKFKKILRLYELQGAGYSTIANVETPLAEDVISVDVGRYQQQDIFVTFTEREAVRYDPRTGKKQSLIRYQSIYNTPARDSIPNLDLFRDINKDGLDDFFIPGYTGVTAYIQREDGSFRWAGNVCATGDESSSRRCKLSNAPELPRRYES